LERFFVLDPLLKYDNPQFVREVIGNVESPSFTVIPDCYFLDDDTITKLRKLGKENISEDDKFQAAIGLRQWKHQNPGYWNFGEWGPIQEFHRRIAAGDENNG
jgi:hypothetical protein